MTSPSEPLIMTAAPLYQRIAVPAGAVLGGLLLLGNVLDAASNARALISPVVTRAGSALVIASAVTLHLYLRRRPLFWAVKGGSVRISGLGPRPLGALGGAILLLWLPRFIDVLPAAWAPRAADPAPRPVQAAEHDGRGDAPIPTVAGWWCYSNLPDDNGRYVGEFYEFYEGDTVGISDTDERYLDESEDDYGAVRYFSTFFMENEGGIVRLDLMVCPEALLDRSEQPRSTLVPDTIRIGAWPVVGLDLVIQEQENGDIVWDPRATGSYDAMRGYFVVLEASGERNSEWLTIRVRPVRIEDALRSRPNPRRPRGGFRTLRGGLTGPLSSPGSTDRFDGSTPGARHDFLASHPPARYRAIPPPARIRPHPHAANPIRRRTLSMRMNPARGYALAVLSAILAAGACQPNAEAPAAQTGTVNGRATTTADPGEWRPLFDGRTTAGWRSFKGSAAPAGWQVVDGALTRVAQAGDIVTEDEFGSFELELEWKIQPGGNSGVFFHVVEDSTLQYVWQTGPEMQVLDNAGHADGRQPNTSAGSNFALYAPASDVTRPAGQWNAARLVVRGDHVEHWLNGQKLLEYELGSSEWQQRVAASKFSEMPRYGQARRGHIALQDHGDPVAFRNIRIRTLPEE